MRKVFLLCSFLFFGCAPLAGIAADYFTAQTLKDDCENVQNPQGHNWTYCLGFINGVVGSVSSMQILSRKPQLFCINEPNMTQGQAVDIFLAYARNHPKDYQLPADIEVISAYMDAYPCDQKPAK